MRLGRKRIGRVVEWCLAEIESKTKTALHIESDGGGGYVKVKGKAGKGEADNRHPAATPRNSNEGS